MNRAPRCQRDLNVRYSTGRTAPAGPTRHEAPPGTRDPSRCGMHNQTSQTQVNA